MKSISIEYDRESRGNKHGYLNSDYARDAAAQIEKNLMNAELLNFDDDDIFTEQQALKKAEEEISECDDSIKSLLRIEIENIADAEED